jgi:AcrR family transcriptional regulator
MRSDSGHHKAREAIRSTATTLFASKGFAATSTREICQISGVTKPVLYYYFGSKNQLFKEIVFDAFNEYIKELDRASSDKGEISQRFRRVLATIFEFTRVYPDLARLAFRMVFAPEKKSPVINYIELGEADERLLAEMARRAAEDGEIRCEPQEVASALIGIARFYMISYLLTGQPMLDERLAAGIVDLVMRGCRIHVTDR